MTAAIPALTVAFPLRGEWVAGHTRHLADVGRSGNSTAPHLHFQLMDRADIHHAQGLPCDFERYEALRNGAWHAVMHGMPGSREFIRHDA